MIRPCVLAATPCPPAAPGRKLPAGPTGLCDPGGASLCRPAAARLKGGVINAETRAIVRASARLMFGRQRTIRD
ncbi:MAG: hypothetical protein O9293_04285 [Porphyrobacter sp.]|nr:hypothetical protein [Porphyrobacter sp.]